MTSPSDHHGQPTCCPRCGSTRLARLLYGLPAMTGDLADRIKRGEVVLAGCDIGEDPPDWQCHDCGARFSVTPPPAPT